MNSPQHSRRANFAKHVVLPGMVLALAAGAISACSGKSYGERIIGESARVVPDRFVIAAGANAYSTPSTEKPSDVSDNIARTPDATIAKGVSLIFKHGAIIVTGNDQKDYLVVSPEAMHDAAGDKGSIPTNTNKLGDAKPLFVPLLGNHVTDVNNPDPSAMITYLGGGSVVAPTLDYQVVAAKK